MNCVLCKNQNSQSSSHSSAQRQWPLDQVHVDFIAQSHTVLQSALVIGHRLFGFNVLVKCVDLGLIRYQFLLHVVQPVVDIALQDLVLLGVMLHRVECHLCLEPRFVLLEELLHSSQSDLFPVEFDLQLICLSELVSHFILHLYYFLSDLLHFIIDSALQTLNLIQIILSLLQFHLQSSICVLSVLHLSLLKVKLFLFVLVLGCRRQIVLSGHLLLHMLQQGRYRLLMLSYILLVLSLLLLELLHEFVYLLLFLVQYLVFLGLILIWLLLLQVWLYLLDVPLVSLQSLPHVSDVFLGLFDLSVVLFDPI